MILGFILVKTNFIDSLRNIEIIGWTTIVFGVLLYISDKFKLEKKIDSHFNYKSALIIGLFQMISLIPGVSRSGITITAARLMNFERFEAAKISFLMSIPTLFAISVFGLNNLMSKSNIEFSIINFLSIIFSFLFSFVTIKYFLKFIQRFDLKIFVAYRIILGLIILGFVYLKY